MTEVLKSHFTEVEYQKVESEIEKDQSFKDLYEKIKNTPDYRLNKLEERVEKTEETFKERFDAFKNAVLEAEKKQTEKKQEYKSNTEIYDNLDKIVKEKSGFGGIVLGWLGIDLTKIAKDNLDEKLNTSKEPISSDIESFFSGNNLKKIFSGMILGLFGLNLEIDKLSGIGSGVIKIEEAVKSGVQTVENTANTKADELNQQGKKLLEEAEFKLKSRLPDLNKEKLELNPETISKAFTSNYILLFMSEGEFNKDGGDNAIKSMENLNFDEISTKRTEKVTYDKIVSNDSINLMSPFMTNKDYLRYVLDSEYFKKCFPSEDRLITLKESVNKSDFDWKKTFTWKEITVILSEKLAYFGATSIGGIKGVLSNSEILNNITDIKSLEGLNENLPDSAKKSLNLIKNGYIYQTNGNIKDFKINEFEGKEGYDDLKTIYDFSQNLLGGDTLNNLKKELGVDFDISESINTSFPLSSMAKLYVMLNGNSDINSWGDSEKISFITWLSNKLIDNSDDTKFSNLGSALIKKILYNTTEEGFLSNGVKEFFKSGASIYGGRFAREEIVGPFNQIKGIIRNNLPEGLKFENTTKLNEYIEDSSASIAMALGLLIMIYPAYKVTKFMTNKYVLTTVIGGGLLYSQVKDNKWLDNITNSIKNYFSKK
ncbi:MAG: hypothetical protein Q8K30_04895 [Candidatus Gracilibacteria bacterium]|nr:hypothetical protein [Candidatus Gracilibacteria bacterium]